MEMLVVLLQLSIYTFYSKKALLKRATLIERETKRALNITDDPRNFSIKPPSWQFYFSVSTVCVYNITNKKENSNFVILSVHEVQTGNAEVISSKIVAFHGRVHWDVFSEELEKLPGKNRNNSINGTMTFLDINRGFKNKTTLNKGSSKFYKKYFISFNTERFLKWLSNNKESYCRKNYVTTWKYWKKDRSVHLGIPLNTKKYFLQFKFVVENYHGVFLIKNILCLRGSRVSVFNSKITGGLFVRTNEDNFKELCSLIESFE